MLLPATPRAGSSSTEDLPVDLATENARLLQTFHFHAVHQQQAALAHALLLRPTDPPLHLRLPWRVAAAVLLAASAGQHCTLLPAAIHHRWSSSLICIPAITRPAPRADLAVCECRRCLPDACC